MHEECNRTFVLHPKSVLNVKHQSFSLIMYLASELQLLIGTVDRWALGRDKLAAMMLHGAIPLACSHYSALRNSRMILPVLSCNPLP